jgi:hypothetical protein
MENKSVEKKQLRVSILPLEPGKMRNQYEAKPARDFKDYSKFLVESDPLWVKYFEKEYEMTVQERHDCRKAHGQEFNTHIQTLSFIIPKNGITLDLSKKGDLLKYLIAKYDVSVSCDANRSDGKNNALFYIAMDDQAILTSKEKAVKKLTTMNYVQKLSESQAIRLARLFHLNTHNEGLDVIIGHLYWEAEHNVDVFFNWIQPQNATRLQALLDIREYIDFHVIEIRNGVYRFGEIDLGVTEDEVIQYMTSSEASKIEIVNTMKIRLSQFRSGTGLLAEPTSSVKKINEVDRAVLDFLGDEELSEYEEVEEEHTGEADLENTESTKQKPKGKPKTKK